jgi:predicted ATPase
MIAPAHELLTSIRVEGYKSIRAARVELGAINVLIGANGAGKSNLVGAFGLLADLADHRLQLHVARQGGGNAILHFGRKATTELSFGWTSDDRGYAAALTPSADDTLIFTYERVVVPDPARRAKGELDTLHSFITQLEAGSKETGLRDDDSAERPVAAAMRSWRPFHFHDTGKSSPVKQKSRIDDNRALRADGENLAAFLFALKQVAPGSYRRIVEAVRPVAPFFDDFSLAPDVINPDVIQVTWRHRSDDALFTADALSDGTLRFICLATLLLQPQPPSLIVIDEPELGLHPFAITQLAALVRGAAARSQVLLATQSVTLLDQFDATEVIVAEQHGGESSFRRLDDAHLAAWKQEYSLGELWLKNVLGGRPA